MTKFRFAIALALGLALAGVSFGQAPAIQPFSFTSSAVSLPGASSSLAGAETGATLQVTTNFAIRQTDFISSAATTNGYFGGVDYTIAPFSKWLNNISPTLNGYNFQLQVTGSAGISRITQANGSVVQHYASLFGGRLNYAIKGSSTYALVGEVQDLNSPGFPHRNNLVISLGPTIRF
jgi:hypothetical protein